MSKSGHQFKEENTPDLRKGLRSQINPGQIAKLDGIGFEWASPKRKKSTAHDEGGRNLMNLNQSCFENQEPDESWEFMFEQYKKCNQNPKETKEQKAKFRNEALKVASASQSPEKRQNQNNRRNEALKQARKSLSPNVKAAQKQKINEAYRANYAERKNTEKSAADAYVEKLSSRILDMVDISLSLIHI